MFQASNYSVTSNIKIKITSNDLDHEEATKNSESPSDNIEEEKECLFAPIS